MIKKCENPTAESDRFFTKLEETYWQITKERGMDYDVPGFDYDSFFQKRRKELEERILKKPRKIYRGGA